MISSTSVSGAGIQGQSLQAEAGEKTVRARNDDARRAENQPQHPAAGTDTVSLSAAAQQAMKAAAPGQATASYYEQFMPVREGFSSANLAAGVTDPAAQPFSQNRPFAEVAEAARAQMDSVYTQMRESGEPYGTHSFEGRDRTTLMGELDRRALHAVASNKGGLFTRQEQNDAADLMRQQQGLAMGLYSGPTAARGAFADPHAGDNAARMEAGVQFMDKVPAEEKAGSAEWAFQRAAMQSAYEGISERQGDTPKDYSSGHPLVELILEALESREPGSDESYTRGSIASHQDLRDQTWFAPYAHRLDAAIEASQAAA